MLLTLPLTLVQHKPPSYPLDSLFRICKRERRVPRDHCSTRVVRTCRRARQPGAGPQPQEGGGVVGKPQSSQSDALCCVTPRVAVVSRLPKCALTRRSSATFPPTAGSKAAWGGSKGRGQRVGAGPGCWARGDLSDASASRRCGERRSEAEWR